MKSEKREYCGEFRPSHDVLYLGLEFGIHFWRCYRCKMFAIVCCKKSVEMMSLVFGLKSKNIIQKGFLEQDASINRILTWVAVLIAKNKFIVQSWYFNFVKIRERPICLLFQFQFRFHFRLFSAYFPLIFHLFEIWFAEKNCARRVFRCKKIQKLSFQPVPVVPNVKIYVTYFRF